jgi:CRP/FNR family transcriptional regulator
MQAFQKFVEQYRTQTFKKGEIILSQDQVPTTAYVVKEGVVKTYNITAEGEERPISFDIKGEIFPAAWVFAKARRTLFFYEAMTDCELYLIPRDEFTNFLKARAEVTYEMFEHFMGYHISFQLRVNALEQPKAAKKVLNTLHYLCLRFGEDVGADRVRIQLPLTQQELANFMGLTRETTSLELNKLQKQNVLKLIKRRYVVDTNRLNSLLDDEYDPGFSEEFTQADV